MAVPPLSLMAVLAHPDDESLGFGGVLARCAGEGVTTALVTATRGQMGRYHGHRRGASEHPGIEALAAIRERELRAAAAILNVADLSLLGYEDQSLDRAEPREVIRLLAGHLRRVRPHVVLTFPPDGAYGHPDHVAISQFTAAAVVAAADAGADVPGRPHTVSKFYYLAWPASTWAAYEEAFRKVVTVVDDVERQAAPWPDWALTTVVDTHQWWTTVWKAVCCHESQITAYAKLKDLSAASHEALWGAQSFYRAFSLVNGGRERETDLFAGLRDGAIP